MIGTNVELMTTCPHGWPADLCGPCSVEAATVAKIVSLLLDPDKLWPLLSLPHSYGPAEPDDVIEAIRELIQEGAWRTEGGGGK